MVADGIEGVLDLAEFPLQAGSKMTALIDAVQKGDAVVVRAFIAAGANLNFTEDRQTPLHYAARKGHADIVKLLIAAGADVNALNYFKDTPLHSAARGKGHPDIAKALIAAGADPNAKNRRKRTPLHYAAVRFDVELGKTLVYTGAHINSKDVVGINPMDLANPNGIAYLDFEEITDLACSTSSRRWPS